jgi:predicted RNA binding protein YcfA (HicA-like mRNA interferase family)
MGRLRIISPAKMVKLLERLGFEVNRQRGAHKRMAHPDGRKTTVSDHGGDLPRGTIHAILTDVGLSVEEYDSLARGL